MSVLGNAKIVRAGTNFPARIWPGHAGLFDQNVHIVCQGNGVSVGRRLSTDVGDSEYRRICYDEVETVDCITLRYRSDDIDVALGLYRDRKSGPFSETAIAQLKVVGSAAPSPTTLDWSDYLAGRMAAMCAEREMVTVQ